MAGGNVPAEVRDAARRRLELDRRVTPAQARNLTDAAAELARVQGRRVTPADLCNLAYRWMYRD